MKERLYLIHSNRGDNGCPACGQYIVWRKVGEKQYVPCDKKPVMCIRSPGSRFRVVKQGEILTDVEIVKKGRIGNSVRSNWFYALEPHVFTCPCIPHQGMDVSKKECERC